MLQIHTYHKHGKIHWAKHSRFKPYKIFRENTFVVPWPAVFIIAKYSQKNFCGTLKSHKNLEGLVQQVFPCLQ